MTSRRLLLWTLPLSAVLVTASMPGAPSASAASDGLRVEIQTDSGSIPLSGPLFDEPSVTPGGALERQLRLVNGTAARGVLTFDIGNVRDWEAGCLETELEAGDTSCGAFDGEIQDDLTASITIDGIRRYAGALTGVDGLVLVSDFASGAHTDMTIGVAISEGSGALLQSDYVTFDLHWTLTGDSGEVLGEQTTAPGQVTGQASTPQTTVPSSVPAGLGSRPALLIPWSLAITVLVGSFLVSFRRTGGRHRSDFG